MKTLMRNKSGQALLETALVVPVLAILFFGIVDYSRAVYAAEVIDNLSGEGSSMASRATALPSTAAAVMTDSDLNMSSSGCVIVTSVTAGTSSGTYKVTGQAQSTTCNSATSKIGCYPPPTSCGSATIPTTVQTVLTTSPSSTVYITEVYYKFSPITPIGSLLHNTNLLPSQLYSVSYY